MGMSYQKILLVSLLSIILSGCNLIPKKGEPVELTKKEEIKQAEKLAKIIERGGTADCKIVNLADSTKSTLMKISGKKMKIEGQEFGDNNSKGFMINDGVYSYIWSEGNPNGYKTKLPTEQEIKDLKEKTESVKTEQSEIKVDQYDDETKFKVECKEGSVADSEFTPPATVKFIDPTEMMKGLPAGIPAGVMDKLPK